MVCTLVLLATLLSGAQAQLKFTSASSSAAPAKKTLRVMTYNIHVGERIAEVINRGHPDLVGLQEVDRGVKRTEGKDEIAELAKLTALNYAFAHNLDYQGGQYGVAFPHSTN